MSFLDSQDLLRARLLKPGRDAKALVDDLEALRLTRDDMMETLTEVVFSDNTTSSLDSKTKAAVTREWTKRCGKAEKVEKAEKGGKADAEAEADAEENVDDSENEVDFA